MIGYGFLAFFSVGVSGYAIVAYGLFPLGAVAGPEFAESFLAHAPVLYAHVFASTVALLIGPFQFSRRLRDGNRSLHRWMGRVYLSVGVLVGGLAGLYLAWFAFGGPVARVGFGLMAMAWLYTGVRAYLAIRRGDIQRHREWMFFNFSLTFAAVTLRLYMPLSQLAGVPVEVAYPVVAWLCWVPNLLVAKLLLNGGSRKYQHAIP